VPRTSTKSAKGKSIEEAVSYAVASRIRVEVLAALNERSYSAAELAKIVHQPLSTVTHHIEELLKSRSIEVGKTVQVRNITQNFYRAVDISFFTDEEMEAMTAEARQEVYGLILQSAMAEALTSFWMGKITDDPRSVVVWRWCNVDDEGRSAIADEQARSWKKMQDIEVESAARRAESGEESRSILITSLGYERGRNSPHTTSGNG
jgi:DNA-binding transcriptional ArsR family regulator